MKKNEQETPQDQDNKTPPPRPGYPLLGVSMPLCLLIGFFLGRYLDRVLGTSPYLIIICTLLGIVAGYVQLFRVNKRD